MSHERKVILFLPSKTSRREFVAGVALLGASSLVRGSASLVPAPASQPALDPAWPAEERKSAIDQLIHYFGKTAPLLLRDSEGILVHPSISCSLPGKHYSTNLWDWDTCWTARGLFRVAAMTNDPALRTKIGEYAIGSFTNFFDQQSEEGRIPMLIDVHNADPLGCVKKEGPIQIAESGKADFWAVGRRNFRI